jgi:acyl-CoA thioester hydrolase
MAEPPPTNSTSVACVRGDAASIEIELRVRYPECDPAGMAHHGVYPVWLEIARTELLRHNGMPYAKLEADGVVFVVARMCIRYRKPIRYDDLLKVRARVVTSAHAKVDHEYEITCNGQLAATASTTLVCVDPQGRPRSIPPGVMPQVSGRASGG